MKKHEAFPTPHLTGAVLGGRELNMEIHDVKWVLAYDEETKQKEEKAAMYFKGASRYLILNKTMWKEMENLTGNDDSDDWKGLTVCLYPIDVKAFGKMHNVVRIKAATGKKAADIPDGMQASFVDEMRQDTEDKTADENIRDLGY